MSLSRVLVSDSDVESSSKVSIVIPIQDIFPILLASLRLSWLVPTKESLKDSGTHSGESR